MKVAYIDISGSCREFYDTLLAAAKALGPDEIYLFDIEVFHPTEGMRVMAGTDIRCVTEHAHPHDEIHVFSDGMFPTDPQPKTPENWTWHLCRQSWHIETCNLPPASKRQTVDIAGASW